MAAVTAQAPCAQAFACKENFLSGRVLRQASPVSAAPRRGLAVRATSDKPVKPTRETWFASPQSLTYLDGTLPGDFGFDPLGLMDPEGAGNFIDPKWLPYAEIINGRWAMLGAAGMIAPEILGAAGLVPKETGVVWFKSGVIPPLGTYDYWADPYALFVLEIVLVAFAEHRRAQDYYYPGYAAKTPLLGIEKLVAGSGDPTYPGGPFFNFAGLGKDAATLQKYKISEVKNGRLAMLAFLGFVIQAIFTGVGPFQNLLDHLADPVNNNVLTNLKIG